MDQEVIRLFVIVNPHKKVRKYLCMCGIALHF